MENWNTKGLSKRSRARAVFSAMLAQGYGPTRKESFWPKTSTQQSFRLTISRLRASSFLRWSSSDWIHLSVANGRQRLANQPGGHHELECIQRGLGHDPPIPGIDERDRCSQSRLQIWQDGGR